MTKTKKITISIGVLIILGLVIYWYFPRTPATFPSDKELIGNINDTQTTIRVEKIQDKIKIDEEHFFVPFISTTGDYGTSYWEWQNIKWKVLNIDNSGEPKVWKIDSRDPSTFRLVWNLREDDKIDHMKLFLNRERNFHVTDGVGYYYPKLQMEKRIETSSVFYGSMKLPNDWLSVIESLINMDSAASPDLFDDFDLNRYMYFAWKPYEKSGVEARIQGTNNGYSFYNDDIELDLVRLMDDYYFESSH